MDTLMHLVLVQMILTVIMLMEFSITQGLPRQHVWTYVAGNGENNYDCPCSNGSSATVPAFVGSDYYCESGPLATDPLWDGE